MKKKIAPHPNNIEKINLIMNFYHIFHFHKFKIFLFFFFFVFPIPPITFFGCLCIWNLISAVFHFCSSSFRVLLNRKCSRLTYYGRVISFLYFYHVSLVMYCNKSRNDTKKAHSSGNISYIFVLYTFLLYHVCCGWCGGFKNGDKYPNNNRNIYFFLHRFATKKCLFALTNREKI